LIPRPSVGQHEEVVVHLGEKLNAEGRIDRTPPGSVRYLRLEQRFAPGEHRLRLVIPPDERNTGPAAVKMPASIGEVYPFRWAEIESLAAIDPTAVRQVRVHYSFDETASDFTSSDPILNAVWDICKYTMKATTFCGVLVDGDRERIPYEGDAYINQLGLYYTSPEHDLIRYTLEYLLRYPTWPTEWQLISVLMAWEDYLHSGEKALLEAFYDTLALKTLADLAREDGLISVETGLCTEAFERRLGLHHPRYIFQRGLADLVDWPPGSFTQGGIGERDGHEMMPINTVVNALHCEVVSRMADIAGAIGRDDDARRFAKRAELARKSLQHVLFDAAGGLYIDGEGSNHSSLHSNMVPLAFGMVPPERCRRVVDFVKSRGMACSPYAAQYLLDALYARGEADAALDLMTATHDRSWCHMITSGSTMTWEAWDWKYKNNIDWNHAWGAVPANVIPRRLMGVRPAAPGFRSMVIQPQPGSLQYAKARVPTGAGPVELELENEPAEPLVLAVEIPEGAVARVGLPARDASATMTLDGVKVEAPLEGSHRCVGNVGPGKHRLTLG
jgi:alpha-L-rhamnosidase